MLILKISKNIGACIIIIIIGLNQKIKTKIFDDILRSWRHEKQRLFKKGKRVKNHAK
jgi:hypothetical protein